MARIKIELPADFPFTTIIPIRITDVNYGGHVGNDSILSLIHEARVQYLASLGYEEMNMEGIGLIMSDVNIEFKGELFYGESIVAHVAAKDLSRISFDVYYKFVKQNQEQVVVVAKTGMVCYDYDKKKIVSLPAAAKQKLSGT